MVFHQEQIKQIIPHREEFLLIDEITQMDSLKSATGIKYIKADDWFFKGHFPQYPVMPGVLILESLAQVFGCLILSQPEYQGKLGFFTGVKNAKFKGQVKPGDKLVLKVEVTALKSIFGVCEANAYVNDKLVCSAELSFAIGSK